MLRRSSLVIVSARIIVMTNNQKMLLLQRGYTHDFAPGLWEFPGGKLNDQSGIFDIKLVLPEALRELSEETGIELGPANSKLDHWGATDESAAAFGHNGDKIYTHIFICRWPEEIVAPTPRLSSEHINYVWAEVGELKDFSLTPVTAVVVRAILEEKQRFASLA
ncbi:MAG: NUDIX hydrolase [Candidatus Komeilibacteria bacterium]